MDYKKLSDAIRLCGSTPKIDECKEKCPYYAGGDMMKCIPVMTKDAADVIIELNKELDEKCRYISRTRTLLGCNTNEDLMKLIEQIKIYIIGE